MTIAEHNLVPRRKRTLAVQATQGRKVVLSRHVQVVGSHISGSVVGRLERVTNVVK